MIKYFDSKTKCLCCDEHEKLENQIVCDHCHELNHKPESFEDEE